MSMQNVRVAVAGTGHLGAIHTRLWKQCKGAELTGVFDADAVRAAAIATEHGIRAFTSFDELLQHCDAVTIAAPTSAHYDIALAALLQGKHCFIEKPITASYSEAEKLIAEAEQRSLVIQVGHVERFNPAITSLGGYDIAPMFIEAHRLAQFKPRATDVSVVLDLMIHDLDIVLWLVKSPVVSIAAHGVSVLTETTDIANARITFANGCVANITASRISAQPMRKLRMFQRDAYISVDFAKGEAEIYRLADKEHPPSERAAMLGNIDTGTRNVTIVYEKPEFPQVNAIAEEQNAFISSIRAGAPIAMSARDAAEALRLAEIISEEIAAQNKKIHS